MGVLNVTPDSFSDGGQYEQFGSAVTRALAMVAEGAAIIDVGGESSRPGSQPVSEQEELDRVIPVIEKITNETDTIVSIDTCKPNVMRAAVQAGARFINDINALRAEGALEVASLLQVPVCVVHMQGRPRDMQRAPSYTDVVEEVLDFLLERTGACLQAGIAAEKSSSTLDSVSARPSTIISVCLPILAHSLTPDSKCLLAFRANRRSARYSAEEWTSACTAVSGWRCRPC